jgi:hypothetical protein
MFIIASHTDYTTQRLTSSNEGRFNYLRFYPSTSITSGSPLWRQVINSFQDNGLTRNPFRGFSSHILLYISQISPPIYSQIKCDIIIRILYEIYIKCRSPHTTLNSIMLVIHISCFLHSMTTIHSLLCSFSATAYD